MSGSLLAGIMVPPSTYVQQWSCHTHIVDLFDEHAGSKTSHRWIYRKAINKDNSPNGISPPLWSDWTWHNLKVVLPLLGTGEITPNPALSGYRVHITVETEGYAEEVTVKFPSDSFFNGDEITLSPDNPVSNKYNTFRGTYRTDTKTPDGNYNVIAIIRRFNLAPETVTENMTMAIQGDIYDQVKVRIKDSR
jgi:hypothetical protein